MPTDTTRLQGEVIHDPENQELDVERMLMGFLRALLDEQKTDPSKVPEGNAKEAIQ